MAPIRVQIARALSAPLSLAAAAVLTGCNLGGSPAVEELAVREAITADLIQHDAGDCTELKTQRFLEQVQGKIGSAALEDCREAETRKSQEAARQVFVSDLEIEGDLARAGVSSTGGWAEGIEFSFDLVREDGQWKLDRLEAIKLDRSLFWASQVNLLRGRGLNLREANCVVRGLRSYETAELKRALFPGSGYDISWLGAGCLGLSSLREQVAIRFRILGRRSGTRLRLTECIIDRVLGDLGEAGLRRLLAGNDNGIRTQSLRVWDRCWTAVTGPARSRLD